MTTNLQEFLAMATLVTCATGFVTGFRYAIFMFDRRGQEEMQSRQQGWNALAVRVKKHNRD